MQIIQEMQNMHINLEQKELDLCRTEHMFFAPDRIAAMREMIVSKTAEQREKALAKLLTNAKRRF